MNSDNIKNTRQSKSIDVEKLNSMITPDHIKKPFITPNIIKNTTDRSRLHIVDAKRKALEQNLLNNVTQQTFAFLKPNKNWYLNFGGTGDLVILLASCYDDVNAQVIFYANGGSLDFSKEFLNFFQKDYYISRNIMGSQTANKVYDHITQSKNFKPSGHLSKGLFFGDWPRNIEYYRKNMRLRTGWMEEIGKNADFNDQKIIIIQPSGSNKSLERQRYLTIEEYNAIVKRFVNEGKIVITTGSLHDKQYYNWRAWNNKNFFMTSNQLFGLNTIQPIDFRKFLQTIHSAETVYSCDTWMKTYTAICGMETIVFQNRCRGGYLRVGSDVGDSIFLNTDFWPNMRIIKIEEVVKF